jgi:hypothetical protein
MSRAIFEAPMLSPRSFLIGDTVREILIRWPSFVCRIRLVVVDAFAPADSTEDERFFILSILRDKERHRLSYRLVCRVAEENPGRHDSSS